MPLGTVRDEKTWERAKATVRPYWDQYDEPWAVVMYLYKRIMQAHGKIPFHKRERK